MRQTSSAIVFLVVTASMVQGATLRVPADHATIQAAIDAASTGDEILVGPGTYEITQPIVFRGKGVRLASTSGPDETTVRMLEPVDASRGSVFAFEQSEPPETVLEGFTITGGRGNNAAVAGIGVSLLAGGGVFVGTHAAPRLDGNRIEGNEASVAGGILCDVDSQPVLVGNRIAGNVAAGVEVDPERYEFAFGGGGDRPARFRRAGRGWQLRIQPGDRRRRIVRVLRLHDLA